MVFTLKNITTGDYLEVCLPQSPSSLISLLGSDEYFILDGILDFEYSVLDLNHFLIQAQAIGISDEDLRILSSINLSQEEILHKDYSILPFQSDTQGWNCGNGGDITNVDDIGIYLFEMGHIELPFQINGTADYSYIDWEYALTTVPYNKVLWEDVWYLVV